ncbi:MAG: PIN domain-containing protein [Actinomycetota bacterium]
MSTLGLRFVLDTNAVDDESAEMAELRQMWRDGWIELTRTDTMDTELTQREDAEHRARLLSLSGEMIEQFGPMVLGHSRLGFCVVGSDQEAAEWDRLWEVMFPGRDRATAKKNDVRDAMHVATAIRYGINVLITSDKRLLKRADEVKAAFNGFSIMAPAQALAFSRRMLARHELRINNPRP